MSVLETVDNSTRHLSRSTHFCFYHTLGQKWEDWHQEWIGEANRRDADSFSRAEAALEAAGEPATLRQTCCEDGIGLGNTSLS